MSLGSGASLEAAQEPDRGAKAGKPIVSFLIRIVGIVLAIIAFTREQVGFGFGLLLTSALGSATAVIVVIAIIATGHPAPKLTLQQQQACLNSLQAAGQMPSGCN